MAAATHTVGYSWGGGGLALSSSNSYSGSGEYNIVDEQCIVADNTVVNWTCDKSEVQSIYMHSDREVLLETNANDGSVDVITLKADVPYTWQTGVGYATIWCNTADVTVLYVTNASGATATLNIRCITDATP